jgi:hypothetical protein
MIGALAGRAIIRQRGAWLLIRRHRRVRPLLFGARLGQARG